jgi:hypothetical protein
LGGKLGAAFVALLTLSCLSAYNSICQCSFKSRKFGSHQTPLPEA